MHDPRSWLILFALVWLGVALLGDGKKVSWIRLPRLVKATKTRQGIRFEAFMPAKPKKRARRKR